MNTPSVAVTEQCWEATAEEEKGESAVGLSDARKTEASVYKAKDDGISQ